jgi:hypothetical protein
VEDFNFVLLRYGLERLLFRLGQGRHAGTFVLKGAMLFPLWSGSPHRATKDMDLLGSGPPDLARLIEIFREVVGASVDDGVTFLPATVVGAAIREEAAYDGIRITLEARLGVARIPLQVDIGFGDAVTPAPVETTYPVLLPDMPVPRLRVYPRETVIAEKVEAMVTLGLGNSRMKDFFDIWYLARTFEFDEATLRAAIRATFSRRQRPLPHQMPLALTTTFVDDASKAAQWRAFAGRSRAVARTSELAEVVDVLASLLKPVLIGDEPPSARKWQSGEGRWR